MLELLGEVENLGLEANETRMDSFWDEKYKDIEIKDKYKVVFITSEGGEENYAINFKVCAEKIGWEVKVFLLKINNFIDKILKFDPDFILFSLFADRQFDSKISLHKSKKYLFDHSVIEGHLSFDHMTKNDLEKGEISPQLTQYLQPFDGVVALESLFDLYQHAFIKLNKTFYGIYTHPTIPDFGYNEPVEPKSIAWGGMGWDKFRNSDNFKNFIKKLSQNLPMKIYGKNYLSFVSDKVYAGFNPPGLAHIEAIHNNGIFLLTHADSYLNAEVPTSRIFEALSANVIVISDKHPFIIKTFGNNIS